MQKKFQLQHIFKLYPTPVSDLSPKYYKARYQNLNFSLYENAEVEQKYEQ